MECHLPPFDNSLMDFAKSKLFKWWHKKIKLRMKLKKEVKWFECCPAKKQQLQEPCSDIRCKQGEGSQQLHWNSNFVVVVF